VGNSGPVLEFDRVRKSFGPDLVFADLSFTVEPAEVVALTGPNGSGKSTLLKCLVGLDHFESGRALFDGAPYLDVLPKVRADVAVGITMGEDFVDLTVREHLEFMARAHGDDRPERVIDPILDELGLVEVQDHFPFTLSQGQRRRMGLASCFVRPRRLLLLDEPEQNLDLAGREWLAEKLRAESAAGVAVLMATHDATLVTRAADAEVTLPVEDVDLAETDEIVGRVLR